MEQQTTYNANSIAVLEGLEAVRKRPGMYIGSVSTRGLNHLIYEIVDNAVDEHLAGYCSNIQVILDEDGTATIQDNGRGIPTGINSKTGIPAVEMVFTMLHAGGKFGTGGYKISGGLHGVGASVVNALSVWLEVKVRSEGKVYQQMYEKGKAVAQLEVIGTCRKGDTGTTVTFLPDGEIFDKTYFKAESIKSRLHETAYLNPGLSITFENRRPGEEETVLFHEEEGLKAYVRDLNKGKPAVGEIVYFKKKVDDIEVEAAFQYVDEFQETIMGFCNNICTMEGGTHITGFKTKFTSVMNQYARELGILKEKDKKIKEELIMLQDKIKGVYIGSKQEEKELNLKEETGKKYNLLTRAIKEKRKVKLLYYSYGKGENQRIIYPAEMFLFQNGWYCAAFCEMRQDIRHFELKRIINCELLDEKYE